MSTILRILGLEQSAAMKATHAESREAFEAQLRERSVTTASRKVQVEMGRLNRVLKEAVEETSETRRPN